MKHRDKHEHIHWNIPAFRPVKAPQRPALAGLTQTVVSVVGQHEAIVAGTPVVSRNVDAFMDTSAIVVVLTFIHV